MQFHPAIVFFVAVVYQNPDLLLLESIYFYATTFKVAAQTLGNPFQQCTLTPGGC